MNHLALLVALGAWGFVWWRTRPREDTEAGRGEAEADDGAGPTMGELQAVQEALGEQQQHLARRMNGWEAWHDKVERRLDALEAREVPDVSGLREDHDHLATAVEQMNARLSRTEEEAGAALDLTMENNKKAGLSRRELMSLIAPVWSMLYTVQQSEPDLRETEFQGHRFLDMRMIHYLDETDRPMQAVATQAEAEVGVKVFFDPDLRLLAVGFLDPMGAPETLAGAIRLAVDRHRWKRQIDEKSTPGDDVGDWRNE